MKHLIRILLISILGIMQNYAQLQPSNINIALEPVSGDPFKSEPFTYKLRFENKTQGVLNGNNWVIYFNKGGSNKAPDFVKDYVIERVNGVLYQIKPNSGFANISAGDSFEILMQSSGPIMNKSDLPNGFFIHYLNENKFFNLQNPTLLNEPTGNMMFRSVHDALPVQTPALIYENNKRFSTLTAAELSPILPTPSSEIVRSVGQHTLNAGYQITHTGEWKNEIQYLKTQLDPFFSKTKAKAAGRIHIKQAADLKEEAYRLRVTPDMVHIEAGSAKACFYAIQSLMQLVPTQNYDKKQATIALPAISFSDEPRFAYRAIHLDVSRNFQPKEQIFKLLDAMAMYKLNVFHFHFSDDDGWRIEMPSLPELTEVGAKRGITDPLNMLTPVYGSGAHPDNLSGSGFYTRADFVEILQYAHQRHIEVIPEIETPGHARAAVIAMEARYRKFAAQNKMFEAEQYRLHHPEDASQYHSVQYYSDNIMDVSLPSTYAFIERVVDDLRQMYADAGAPLRTIHMGGDEVPNGVWEKSPAFAELKKQQPKIETTDDLWFYFFDKVNRILQKRDLFLSGWEEAGVRFTMLDGRKKMIPNPLFVNENFHLDVWNNVPGGGHEDLAYTLANAGYKVVLSCVTHNYFDMAVYKSFDEPGYYWGSFVSLQEPFAFIPFDYFKNLHSDLNGNKLNTEMFKNKVRLTDYGKSNIVGIKGLLWTETVTDERLLHYKMFPNLIALAERAWAPSPHWAHNYIEQAFDSAYNQFLNQLGQRELGRLDVRNGGYLYRIPQPGIMVDKAGMLHVNMEMPGFVVRYTTDGTAPTNKSSIYSKPFKANGEIQMSAFSKNGKNQSNISKIIVE